MGQERYAAVAPRDPKEVECEFCEDGSRATKAHAMTSGRKHLPTGQYVYTCPRHHALGEEAVSRR